MLSKFGLQNFKSIGEEEVKIELKPLTILLGPNGSGKSSILEGLALLAQSAITGQLTFEGEYLNYPYEKELFHGHDPQNWMAMEVHAGIEKEGEIAKLAEEVNKASLGVSAGVDTVGYRYSIGAFFTGGELKWEQSIFSDGKLMITAGLEYDETERLLRSRFKHPPVLKGSMATPGDGLVFSPSAFTQMGSPVSTAEPLGRFARAATELIASKLTSREKRSKISYISGVRGEIKPEEKTGKWPEWVGKHGENLPYILTRLQSPENEPKRKKIDKWALEFKVSKPWAGLVGANKVGGSFVDAESGVSSNLALASYGSRQILTIITQLFWSEPGDIIMIEEPEISLHPESQAKLPELFADAISEGKQIIVTTHSDFFPYALRKAIESKEHHLDVKDIAVYEIKRDKDGCTRAKQQELDETGYIEGWIPSFRRVDEELSQKWFKTLEKEE